MTEGIAMHTPDLSQATWRKSTHSNGGGGTCVEVTFLTEVAAVRDSKNIDGPALTFHEPAFHEFLARIKAGQLDR